MTNKTYSIELGSNIFHIFTALVESFSHRIFLVVSVLPVGRVMSCELHTQVLTLKVTSPELGIGPLSLDTDLTILQLREITGRWKPGRIATEGHSEVLFLYLYGQVSGCSVLKVLRGFDPRATPDMLTWCLREYMLWENHSKWKQATAFVPMLHYIYYFFNNEQM